MSISSPLEEPVVWPESYRQQQVLLVYYELCNSRVPVSEHRFFTFGKSRKASVRDYATMGS